MIHFILNNKEMAADESPGMVLLDFIRYHQHLAGTKIGCREGDCGACTVLVGELIHDELQYHSVTSCLVPLGNAAGKHIVTIEGVNPVTGSGTASPGLTPVQKAMADAGATQCGFCTPGFVMSLTGFCLNDTEASKENAVAAIDGNICRCTGYKSIERAADKIVDLLKKRKNENILQFVTAQKILPEYFTGIKEKLQNLAAGKKTPALTDTAALDKRPHFVGGGTDLYVQKHDEMKEADIYFLFNQPGLDSIHKEGNKCFIGPSVTVSDLQQSPIIQEAFPSFNRYAKLVSSTPIRNMATIAGNFINASPIGDFTIFFLALDAQLILSDGKTKRTLPLRKLYKGYKTLDKTPGEHIEQIWFELPGKNTRFHFEKVSKRTHLDIASVNSAIFIKMNGDSIGRVGIAAGGVGPVPLYLQKTAAFLKGKNVTEQLIREAIKIMQTEITPISDARGTKEYKTLLLGQLIKAHFMELFPPLIFV
ncbi:MAG: FAD binding domain-containing protein [Chitinophagaceae bacterium]